MKYEDLLRRLCSAGVASCTCQTKTNIASYHATTCRYRAIEEAIEVIRELTEPYVDENQVTWFPPTAWAYAQLCKAHRKLRDSE